MTYDELFYAISTYKMKKKIILSDIYNLFTTQGISFLLNNVSAWALKIPPFQKQEAHGQHRLPEKKTVQINKHVYDYIITLIERRKKKHY